MRIDDFSYVLTKTSSPYEKDKSLPGKRRRECIFLVLNMPMAKIVGQLVDPTITNPKACFVKDKIHYCFFYEHVR